MDYVFKYFKTYLCSIKGRVLRNDMIQILDAFHNYMDVEISIILAQSKSLSLCFGSCKNASHYLLTRSRFNLVSHGFHLEAITQVNRAF